MPTTVMYGPTSEVYNTYAVVSPAPGDNGVGGPIAQLHHQLMGQQLVTSDGRKFRFGAAGSGTLVIGNVLTAGVATASQQDLTAAAGAVDDRIATMTTGASSALNTFAEGHLIVSVTPGAGQVYEIASHALMTSGAGDVVNFAPGHALRVATTGTSRYDLIPNPYKAMIQSPATTVASMPMGVAVSAATTIQGCWVQTRGQASVLTSGSAIAGDLVGTGLGTAGALGPIAAIATQPIIGLTVFAAASGAWSTIFLTLDL